MMEITLGERWIDAGGEGAEGTVVGTTSCGGGGRATGWRKESPEVRGEEVVTVVGGRAGGRTTD